MNLYLVNLYYLEIPNETLNLKKLYKQNAKSNIKNTIILLHISYKQI